MTESLTAGPVPGEPAAWASGGAAPYPETTLHTLILEHARRTPEAEAIRQWNQALTYQELAGAAASVAARLRREGAGPETRIGICTRRTTDLPVAVLGVLLTGAAFVPLDPDHPRARLTEVLTDAGVGVIAVDGPGAALVAGRGRRLVTVSPGDRPGAAPGFRPDSARPDSARPDNAAYVMYTSGSTGRPKGVVISHRNVLAYRAAVQLRGPLGAGCRSAGFSALGFDASVFDLLVPLTLGAAVQLVPDEDRVDPVRLARFLREHRVTRAMLPPPLMPLLDPGMLPDLADLFSAGEPCGPEQVARWSAAGKRRFHNWYGPTETTVSVIGTQLDGAWGRPLPIGRPLPGCTAWVLDERMRRCPAGTAGDLFIGGPQLARGYLGQPGKTAECFVPDPFGGPGARLYRTGDLARWESGGVLAFLGRRDRQVKIQGQRVEIGEVETVLLAHPAVRQAVVDVAAGTAGLKRLIAYVTPADVPDLREYVAGRLPGYMTPSRVHKIATFPLTVAGKVDMAALRALAAAAARPAPPPAAPPEDLMVARAWAEVLDAPAAPGDEFIAAGGDSMLAMRLAAALRSRTGRQVGVQDVYRGGTVAGIAERVRRAEPLAGDEAVPGGSPPALAAGQRRIWFVEQLTPGRPMHNVALAQRLRGRLDLPALRAALRAVTSRHQALRWQIGKGGRPAVAVAPPGEVSLPVTDLRGLDGADGQAAERAVRELLNHEAATPVVLGAGLPWRARLIRLAPEDHVLAITVHHIVFDGWSRDVLYRDLGAAYREALTTAPGPEPGPAGTGYADYVAWADRRAHRQAASDLAWWRAHLAGAPAALDLPRDAPRPPVQTFRGAAAEATVSDAVSNGVREVARRAQATPFAVLLSAFAQLARRLTGQRDLVIAAPVADRPMAAFEPLIGLCLHMLPLRLAVSDDVSFTEHVRRCRDELGAALAHPSAPLERIVDALGQPRDLSRNPLFQVLFNAYDLTGPGLAMPGIEAEPVPAGLPGSLFDLTLYLSERDGRFALRAVYNPDLFTAARIGALLASYLELLAGLTSDPGRPAGSASLRPGGSALPGGRGPLPDEREPLPGWTGPGVLERVRAAALAAPEATAITGQGGVVRYRELTAICDATAAALRSAGVAAGHTVAVLAQRDVLLPAVMLGVLAAGARWLILDAALADPRAAGQLTAAGARALIRWPGTPLPDGTGDGLRILDAAALGAAGRAAAATAAAQNGAAQNGAAQNGAAQNGAAGGRAECADAPAAARGYLSLTSGTTGEPKVVQAAEQPLAHFLAWYAAAFGLGPRDRFALLAGLAHDPLLRDAFAPLVLGGCLCVPAQESVRDPARLAAWLAAEQVTVAHLTPQAARLLTAADRPELPRLRLIALGGDLATAGDAAALRRLAPAARLINVYGTTETPQAQAWHEVTDEELERASSDGAALPLPVGRGIDGAQLLVVSPHGSSAGIGELGEVVIRSRYLAAGYLGGEGGAPRFSRDADPADRRFATGDLGRYLPDGTVVLAGRADGQVKIRGYRVELGEIEAVLAAHPDVRQACVTVSGDTGEGELWAHVVPAVPRVTAAGLREQLRARLPGYAVPAGISLLPALPLTPNGKVDRAALHRPVPGPARGGADEPAGGSERLVAAIWCDVLGVPALRATDNFFESGGHSLAIVTVQARLAQQLGRTVPVVDLFQYPTVRALASHLDRVAGDAADAGIERAAQRAAQRRERARLRSARQQRGVPYAPHD